MGDDLKDLLDRESIRDLAVRYCDRIVARDAEGVVSLYSPDGEFIVPETAFHIGNPQSDVGINVRRYRGTTELREMLSASFREFAPIPSVSNNVIQLTGPDTASGRCLSTIRYGQDTDALSLAFYDDEYARSSKGWVFLRRTLKMSNFNRKSGARVLSEPGT